MSDKILSQQEIEAMLASMALNDEPAGATPGLAAGPSVALAQEPDAGHPSRPVKVYDFRRPDKFSKEHLRALRILHGTFARTLASSLTSYMRTSFQIRLTMVEQVTYDEYIRSLPTPTVMYIVNAEPLPGQMVVELNLGVARAVLDRLLGGSGLLSTRARDMTEIEMTLLTNFGSFLVNSLREVWADVVAIEPSIQEPVLSPEFVQVTLAGETTVMLVFEVAMLRTTGTLSICLPHPVLAPVLEKLTSQVWFSGSQSSSESTELRPQQQLRRVTLPLTVDLGATELSVRELLDLAVGQVIKLDTPANGELLVRIDDQVKFAGKPGVNGKNLAVQVTEKFTGGPPDGWGHQSISR